MSEFGAEGIKNLRNGYFTTISSPTMRTVADRHDLLLTITSTADDLSRGINIDDLERL